MDPLGSNLETVDIATLTRWDSTEVEDYDIQIDSPEGQRESDFKLNNELNRKIILWSGDLARLNTEAIVNSTNEGLNDKNILSERIFRFAGSGLQKEIRTNIKSCRTGEAKLTKGYNLPCRYIIHTVGPRYNIKYRTAAESALYNSYRNVMQVVKETAITSIGLCCINSMRRGYPPEEGAHIAIRTVRRFLEKYGDTIDTVVFCATEIDEMVYKSVLPLYFPRTVNEENYMAYHLPPEIGNELGEPVIEERKIRILDKPMRAKDPDSGELEDSINLEDEFELSVAIGNHAFSKMEKNPDTDKKAKLQGRSTEEMLKLERQRRYERWLKRAKTEDLSEIAALRCFYHSGVDRMGRPVVIFVGRNFASDKVDLVKALLYFINLMEPLVSQPYVMVYLHTLTSRDNQPHMGFLKEVYYLVDDKYRDNLRALYVVHPTVWTRLMSWFVTTFSISGIRNKVHSLPGVEYLYTKIRPDQLDIPAFVLDHDIQLNGTNYYNCEALEHGQL
ncbi:unnamed protein product [Owenia fusiformis]|uniref:Uncharacterized protein n=1 Tax=Owenia fusiformis TaxID=6347 RepID=A0A8J1TBB1_OWEFU|nr:unnamed protein product [Owenia fusiformis]